LSDIIAAFDLLEPVTSECSSFVEQHCIVLFYPLYRLP
jgi:hypothetical protein